jgi:malate dehydrogenase (oxaloacetate-decarboxylating)
VLSLDPLPSLDPERPAADLFTALRSGRAAAVRERGVALLEQPLLNKDAAFTEAERDALGLRGLLPSRVMTIEEQVVLELEHVRRKPDDLEKYVGLAALHERNETLFHRVLVENLEEFLPVVYTPTVGRACQEFSHIMRRPRGVWITPDDMERIPEILRNAGLDDVRLIVATDNERILGLGDQGAGGMAIPVGKLALYSTAAGIHPAQTLAVSLDVGTDRLELLEDPLYLGYRHPRLRGTEYDRVIEAFVLAILRVFPMAVLQWEDFKQHNAIRLLDRYRHRICSFNDDIQGTGAVVLAGILAALRHVGAGLAEQRLVLLGSGAAGLGIARTIRSAMRRAGMSEDAIARAIFMLDSGGLLHEGRSGIADDKRAFVLPASILASYGIDPAGKVDLEAVIRAVRPTILIGTSGTPGAFTEAAIRAMADGAEHPIVFPLSNPTANSEAVPSDLLEWTSGRALVAAGSPFAPVDHGGVTRITGQANNVYVFPGVGLGAILAEVREVSDELFIVAAERLAALVTADRLAVGALYPPVGGLREVAREIACAIVRHARDQGLGRSIPDELIEPAVDAAMWWPDYPPLEPG